MEDSSTQGHISPAFHLSMNHESTSKINFVHPICYFPLSLRARTDQQLVFTNYPRPSIVISKISSRIIIEGVELNNTFAFQELKEGTAVWYHIKGCSPQNFESDFYTNNIM